MCWSSWFPIVKGVAPGVLERWLVWAFRRQHDDIAVLPGGRNSGQKANKGPGKKELAGRIRGRILPKGAEENFL
jgi:hypothetical protein